MATNTVTPNANPNLKPQTAVWGAELVTKTITEKDKDGQEVKKTEHDLKAIQGEEAVAKAEKNGTLVLKQTFGYDFPANDEGQKLVVPNAEERNEVFIAGLKARNIAPRIRRAIEEFTNRTEEGYPIPDFPVIEGVYDFRDDIKEEAKKKNLTPMEKALKNLRAIPIFASMTDEQLMGFLDKAALEKASQEQNQDASESVPEEEQQVTA